MKKVAVVIPFYQDKLSAYEEIALQQCEKVLANHDKIAIKPIDFNLPAAAAGTVNFHQIVSFDNHYFTSISGYNKLMLSAQFYKAFLDYEYILIYQMDCFVFSDQLNFWCSQKWDYIGAPWIKKTYHKSTLSLQFLKIKHHITSRFNRADNTQPNQYQLHNQVGNGGFSLRKVKKFYDLSLLLRPTIEKYLSFEGNLYNEDVFWSLEVNRENRLLNIPDCETALKFAIEVPPIKLRKLKIADLPFGCHDWDHYLDYWKPVFQKLGYTI